MFKTYNVSNGEVLGTIYKVNGSAYSGANSLLLKGDLLLALISRNGPDQLFVYNVTSGNNNL